jgi:hypothetical protein
MVGFFDELIDCRHRRRSSTLALVGNDGHHVAQTMPTGAVVAVVDGKPFSGDRLIDVRPVMLQWPVFFLGTSADGEFPFDICCVEVDECCGDAVAGVVECVGAEEGDGVFFDDVVP